MLKTCQFCGKVYKTYDSNRMFCSISCSNNAKIGIKKIKKGNEIKIFNDFAKIIVNSKKFGIKEVLIDLDDIEKVKKYTWCLTHSRDMNLYAMTKTSENKTIKLHRYLMNFPNNKDIDHINHNTLDNRKFNLKVCSRAENNQNLGIRTNTKLGLKYITKRNKAYDKRYKGNYEIYCLQIRRNGINISKLSKSLEKLLKIRNDYLIKFSDLLNIPPLILDELLKQEIK